MHQINTTEGLGFIARHAKLCACAVCELLAELLAIETIQ
jgi:hypothetical protein